MRTPPDKKITFTFYSYPVSDPKMRWKAVLVFEPGSTDETLSVVTVADGEGTPVENGVFEFAGCSTTIKDGKGQIRCGDFVKGKHESAIWLRRKGMTPVRGALTFE